MGHRRGRPGVVLAVLAACLTAVACAAPPAPPPARGVAGCALVGPYAVPAPDRTGTPVGLRLCATGPLTVTSAGAVLDGWDVAGGVVVDAPDVVVRRSRITGDGSVPYGVRTTPRGAVRIEDTTLTGDFPEAAIGDDRWTAERVEITRVTHDGARLGPGATLRNSRLHDFAPRAGVEANALVVLVPGAGALAEGNTIEMGTGPGHGSAVLLTPGGATVPAPPTVAAAAVVIRSNELGGGRQTVGAARTVDGARGVEITGNRFHRDGDTPLRVPPTTRLADNTFVDGGMVIADQHPPSS